MERYTKPPLTYQQQVELLKSRGLQFADEARAKRHLANISYYRMSAYMLPFKEANQEGEILDSFKKVSPGIMSITFMFLTESSVCWYLMR